MADNTIVLQADSIVKMFGGLRAIDNVSLHLNRGEILGLVGPNGAGKTTMFNIIAGAFRPTSGQISVNGVVVRKPVAHKMAKLKIGRTHQIVQPFSNLTVLENTMVGAFLNTSNTAVARKKAMETLERMGLAHKADQRGKDLALVDLKRMEVARALATDPEILLLDEVMAGLPLAESEVMIEKVRDIQRSNISIIIIEHVMRAVMGLCERIYVLGQGKLIAEGTPLEISNNQQVIESYLGAKKHA